MSRRIVIVGAGACGLQAAVALLDCGFHVDILEARNRTGGRINTIVKQGFNCLLESGAEFVHGNLPATKKLAELSGSKLVRCDGVAYNVRNGDVESTGFEDRQWNAVANKLKTLDSDIPLADFLRREFAGRPQVATRITDFVEGFDAADPSLYSTLALKKELTEFDEEEQFRIEGGYSSLIQFLADGVSSRKGKIHFDAEVVAAGTSATGVTAITRDGRRFEGDMLVVTVPIGVLQSGHIQFTGKMPFEMSLFSKFGNGGVIKFFVSFSRTFWETVILKKYQNVQFIFSDARIPTWWSQRPSDAPLLTGWLGGPAAFQMASNYKDQTQALIDSLVSITGSNASQLREAIKAVHVENWVVDPFSLGAYSYPTVDTVKARETIARADGKILFAGEAFHDGDSQSTVEAALNSAEQVVKKVLA